MTNKEITLLIDFGDGNGEREFTVPVTDEVYEYMTHVYPGFSTEEGPLPS